MATRDSETYDFFERRRRGATIFELVGEDAYQQTIRELRKGAGSRAVTVYLEVEPTNVVDANAIRATTEQGLTVGYLIARQAKQFNATIVAMGRVGVDALIVGGTRDKPSVGVYVDGTAVRKSYDADPKRAAKRVKREAMALATADATGKPLPKKYSKRSGCLARAAVIVLGLAAMLISVAAAL